MKTLFLLPALLLCMLAQATGLGEKTRNVPAERIPFVESVNAQYALSQQVATLGTTVSFTDESTAVNTNVSTWSWDFDGDGVEDSNAQNPSYTFPAANHYPVTLTVTNGFDVTDEITKWVSIIDDDIDSAFSYIPFVGLEADDQGIAAWNVEAEPAVFGHSLPQPPASIAVAYYYLASRDSVDSNANSAMSGEGLARNWPNLSQALIDNGLTIADLDVSFGLMTLGNDIENQDWSLVDSLETRYYTGGKFYITLNGEAMISGQMPQLDMYLEYYAYQGGTDKIYGETGFAIPDNNSAESGAVAQTIAGAFLADCGQHSIKFVFSSLQTANQFEFRANGRWGGFFDLAQGFLIKDAPCALAVEACNDVVVMENEAASLSATVSEAKGNVVYDWVPAADLDNSNSATPEATVSEDTKFTLTVTDERGCIAQDTVWVRMDVATGLYEEPLQSIKVFSHDGKLIVNSSSKVLSSLAVYNINGKLLSCMRPKETFTEISHLQKGVYIVKCQSETSGVVKKVVVQ